MSLVINTSPAGEAFRIPKSIVAPTRDELERLMLINNLKHSFEFRYFDIQKTDEGWVAWFNVTIDKDQFFSEKKSKRKPKGGSK